MPAGSALAGLAGGVSRWPTSRWVHVMQAQLTKSCFLMLPIVPGETHSRGRPDCRVGACAAGSADQALLPGAADSAGGDTTAGIGGGRPAQSVVLTWSRLSCSVVKV